MNANELADSIEQDPYVPRENADLIVAALRQYAALEWLWETGEIAYVQKHPSTGPMEAGGAGRRESGPTVSAAILHLQKKLEPPKPPKQTTSITINTGDRSVSLPILTDGNGDCWLTPEQCDELEGLRKPPHEHVWDDGSWIRSTEEFFRRCQNKPCPTNEVQRAERLVPAP